MFLVPRLGCRELSKGVANLRVAVTVVRKTTNAPGIITSGLQDVEIPTIPLDEFVLDKSGIWDARVAVECVVTGRNYTYSQLRTKSKNFGSSLRKKLKLQKNDVIAMLLPNVPEFPIVALGAIRAGLICTTINPLYTPEEIARQLTDSSAKVIITLNDFWPLARAAVQSTKTDIPVLTVDTKQGQSTPAGAINFSEFTDNAVDFPRAATSSEDVIFLPYSSGTTGLPKGVQLTHSNIVSNICQLHHPELNLFRETTADYQEVCPAVLPMFHIYGLTVLCWNLLSLGIKITTLPKFEPEMYIKSLRKYKPSTLYVVPPIAIFLAKHPAVKPEDLDSVEYLINGAAPLGKLDEEELIKKANRDIAVLQGYGLTETSPAVLTIWPNMKKMPGIEGALGLPLANTQVKLVAIDDPTGTPLGPNQTGELLVKGPQVMKGYLNRPKENEETFLDGWLRTGDMMYYNDEGFLFITDRLKELIKVKGFQVAPAELEEIVRNFPDVTDAAVIGVPDPKVGEVPRVYIVTRPGAKIDFDKLNEHVNSKVANYKQLKGGICVIDSIPKNATGKILRRELKMIYEKENSS
ncbi:unnamed protein product [Phaedon cochleariae]|uniref:Luciferin 4-monooxygenase n=1 Tax=Phaedon cochleariae TaxID=80249 RepID=A0A9P0DSW8_PHACE|nr:unnamed protein product [Phaedon cochleariae]